MKYDTKYGKITDGVFSYAPRSINNTANPPESMILAAGYLPVVIQVPPRKFGVEFVPDGWKEKDGKIYRTYKEVPVVTPPVVNRKWTRLKMKMALAQAGWLADVTQMLSQIEIAPGYYADKAFSDCNYVEERWPTEDAWNQMLDSAALKLGKTRDEIDAFLDVVPQETLF